MSVSEPRKRRQFLADALFAGGSLAAAALLARGLSREPEPVVAATPSATPTKCPVPEGPYPGEMVAPQVEGRVVIRNGPQ